MHFAKSHSVAKSARNATRHSRTSSKIDITFSAINAILNRPIEHELSALTARKLCATETGLPAFSKYSTRQSTQCTPHICTFNMCVFARFVTSYGQAICLVLWKPWMHSTNRTPSIVPMHPLGRTNRTHVLAGARFPTNLHLTTYLAHKKNHIANHRAKRHDIWKQDYMRVQVSDWRVSIWG